jgi:hypothetical protein
MVFFYIRGFKRATSGIGEITKRCPSCETHTQTDMLVQSRYFHLFWIPLFPTGKEAYLRCQKCGLSRDGIPFDSDLCSNFQEIRSGYKHPWYTYAGVGVIGFVIVGAIVAEVLKGMH